MARENRQDSVGVKVAPAHRPGSRKAGGPCLGAFDLTPRPAEATERPLPGELGHSQQRQYRDPGHP